MSFFGKIKQALHFTSSKISSGIATIVGGKKLDHDALEELEELLISADLGASTAGVIIEKFSKQKFGVEITDEEVKDNLASVIDSIMLPHQRNFSLDDDKLNIILVCGVNGNGKTTTIGKLAHYYKSLGKKVMVAACDTFRAAAIDQLAVWTEKAGVEIIQGSENSDPSSVAYRAVEVAKAEGVEMLFIDTAGRLQTQHNLMEELSKIMRTIEKVAGYPPQHSILVLDATTGQNAFSQVEKFQQIAAINGLIVTKLDGSAKGGVVVGLVQKFQIPIYFIGLGEGIDDLKPFDSQDFTRALVGT
ncbi:MAG: Signal recognition particle receptor FtsY [Pseudomonadota bacterium]|jgi:fused signal recognition particle receptor